MQNFPIAEYLISSEKQCPKRNHILGEHFCKFAVRMNIYTNPELSETERCNSTLLHQKQLNILSKLALVDHKSLPSGDSIKLVTTNENLPNNEYNALNKWRQSAYGNVQVRYEFINLTKTKRILRRKNSNFLFCFRSNYSKVHMKVRKIIHQKQLLVLIMR